MSKTDTTPEQKLWNAIMAWASTRDYGDQRLKQDIADVLTEAHDIGWKNAKHVETN